MKKTKGDLLRGVLLPRHQRDSSISVSYVLPANVSLEQMGRTDKRWISTNFSTIRWSHQKHPRQCYALIVQDLGDAGVLSHGWERVTDLYLIRGIAVDFATGTTGVVHLGDADYRCKLTNLQIFKDSWDWRAACFQLTD